MDANPKSPTLERLEDQISWYDKKSTYNQSWFKRIKIIELIAAALIPFLAGFSTKAPQEAATYYAIATGGLGALIVLLESVQGLYQFQSNWISYRSTCEGLRHEKYLWLAKAGPYADAKEFDRLLAERIESLISTEHAKWVSTKEMAGKKELPIVEKS
jgi:hypothetical protein